MSPAYRPSRLFANPHVATIYAARLARRETVRYRRERWDTPDGDFIDVDFVDGPPDAPRVVMFHGLEGSSRSAYARALMAAVARRGWRGAVPHFRGCSGELNRRPRAYHSGDSAEADWILRRLADGAPLHAAGISLGGNVLAKWCGEAGEAGRSIVTRAASVCAPIDLRISGFALDRGFPRVYTWNFLRTMKRSAEARLRLHPGLFDAERMRRARTFHEFDDTVTAPLHGFAGVADYYARASAGPLLPGVRVPLLLLNALDDPFVPVAALPEPSRLPAAVVADYPTHGGHVGFVGAAGALDWLPGRLLRFFDEGR